MEKYKLSNRSSYFEFNFDWRCLYPIILAFISNCIYFKYCCLNSWDLKNCAVAILVYLFACTISNLLGAGVIFHSDAGVILWLKIYLTLGVMPPLSFLFFKYMML